MECKVSLLEETFLTDSCINRNIVECKDSSSTDKSSENVVLIETLWNVKRKNDDAVPYVAEY